ncbi:MAG: penicillin-binding protein 1A [Gammaproteobacteria bacterium]|nr:penicillin-binding protein 1A [Gammaproteobacteria bacterium]
MKWLKRGLRGLAVWGAGLFALGMIGTLGLYLVIAPGFPDIDTLKDIQLQVPLRVYTRDGEMIAEYGEKRRAPLSYEEFPPYMVQALMSAEDDRFFEHPGVDYKGILRAVYSLVTTGQKSQGGSTITMQVARNFFLSKEKTFLRKFNEIFLSFKIEWLLSKEEIMSLYLNKIYLGHRAYGFSSAAQTYYGKEINDLTLAQLAMLAGLPKAPSSYNPIINPSRATVRRNYVLSRMLELGYIDEKSYQEAKAFHDNAEIHGLVIEAEAPFVGEMVRAEMLERYGDSAYTTGYKVYTTIDKRLQDGANRAVRRALISYNKRHGYRGPIKHIELEMDSSMEEWIRILAEKKSLQSKTPADKPMSDIFSNFLELGHLRLSQQDWEQELKSIPSVANMIPALISGVEEKQANIYMRDGRLITIDWDGLKWAARYENDIRKGALPQKASDVVAVGDIVYVYERDDGTYHLNHIPEAEGAIISLKPQNGAIQAMAGGFDFYQSKFNRVLMAERQPGSNFKPFLYSAALEKGYTPASIINDAPISKVDAALEGVWRPENYSNVYRGPIRLRLALTKSVNTVAVRLLESIGVRHTLRHAARFGIPTTHLQRDLSLALGSGTVTPIDLATGYSVFANGGYRIFPYIIERIEDMEGNIVYQANPVRVCPECLEEEERLLKVETTEGTSDEETATQDDEGGGLQSLSLQPMMLNTEGQLEASVANQNEQLDENGEIIETEEPPPLVYPAERVITPQNAFIMTSILRDVIQFGTGKRAWWSLNRKDLAGKTGTTNDQQDAWFSGFNNQLVTTTWVGFDKPRPLGDKETGATAALPMWIDYMKIALEGVPEENLQQPAGMVSVRIDPETGQLTDANNPNAIFETFREENVPKEHDQATQPAYGEGQIQGEGIGGGNSADENMNQQLF